MSEYFLNLKILCVYKCVEMEPSSVSLPMVSVCLWKREIVDYKFLFFLVSTEVHIYGFQSFIDPGLISPMYFYFIPLPSQAADPRKLILILFLSCSSSPEMWYVAHQLALSSDLCFLVWQTLGDKLSQVRQLCNLLESLCRQWLCLETSYNMSFPILHCFPLVLSI